jgi:hypothetical protein
MKPIDFCKSFSKQPVEQKAIAIKTLALTLETGKNPRGTVMQPDERKYVEQILAWCKANLLMGNTLCPPEHLTKY